MSTTQLPKEEDIDESAADSTQVLLSSSSSSSTTGSTSCVLATDVLWLAAGALINLAFHTIKYNTVCTGHMVSLSCRYLTHMHSYIEIWHQLI